jgi:pimeloyl-ACP methyl ester carboxylesterase
VLVHGSFIDGSCWDGVSATLRDRGHQVDSVELHRGSLSADTAAVQAVIDRIAAPVVVCGWSYGGMVITGLTLPEGSHLVYLCALMPDEGESAISLAQPYPGGIEQLLGTDEAGDLVLQGDRIDEILWGDAPAERVAAMRAALRSQSMASFLEAPAEFAWRTTPSTFVIGKEDLVFNSQLVREMAKRADQTLEWDTSHSPVLSRPELVVDLLDRLPL